MDLVAKVPSNLADLISSYRQNRQRDITQLCDLANKGDVKAIISVGERMYAIGAPYGFQQITLFGLQIREAGTAGNWQALMNVIEKYREYLRDVTITFV